MVLLPDAPLTTVTKNKTYQDFLYDMQSYGIIPNGSFNTKQGVNRATDTNKSKKNDDGWYVYNELKDIAFGAYGSWSGGRDTVKWCSKSENTMTISERQEFNTFQEEAIRKREQDYKLAQEKAIRLTESLPYADAQHPYLVKKKINPHGVYQNGNDLLVPAFNADGEVQTYQSIPLEGVKKFMAQGKAKGTFFKIEGNDKILLCEGFATGASLYEATGATVYCAFGSGNLLEVARIIRNKTQTQITICADNDRWVFKNGCRPEGLEPKLIPGNDPRWTEWSNLGLLENPGVTYAEKVKETLTNITVIKPHFYDVADKPTDFNDLYCQTESYEAIRDYFKESTPAVEAIPVSATLFTDFDFENIPKRQFLYGKFLIRRFCSATISPGGVGKTQLVMTDAVSLATGRALLRDMPHETVKAWHYNLEDPIDELQRRLAAICLNFHVKTDELKGQLFLNSGRDRRLIVLEKTKDGQYARPDADALYKAIKDNGISYLSIDPFVRVHNASENDNKDIDEVLNIFSQIANDTNCAIDLVHHTKKMGKESMAGNMEAARGASAIAGAVRSARTLQVMSDKEAELYGIEQKRRTWYVRVDSAKANMAAPSESADWFERKSVTLPNGNPVTMEEGDKVGVLQYWEPPSITDGLTNTQIKAVFDLIQEGDEDDGFYSMSGKASNYVIPLMEKMIDKTAVQCRALIRKWKSDGYLIEEMMMSQKHRKEKKGLIVIKVPD